MSNETITPKIELLEEQIENIERSGYFTEQEIDRASFSLRAELESLKNQITTYGMTPEEYQEGKEIHDKLFTKCNTIDVIDAEILTSNHTEA